MRVLRYVFLVSLLSSVVGCGREETPTEALEKLRSYAENGQWDQYYDRIDAQGRKVLDESLRQDVPELNQPEAERLQHLTGRDLFRAYQELKADRKRYRDALAGEVVSETVRGSSATISLRRPDGQVKDQPLVLEDGIWKFTYPGYKYDPERFRSLSSGADR